MIDLDSERATKVLAALPDVVLVVDEHGRVAALQDHPDLLAPRDAVLGRNLAELLPKGLADRCRQAIARCIATTETQILEYELEIASGENDFEARLSLLPEREVLVLARNVTARKRAERELAIQRRVGEIAAQAQADFIHREDQEKVLRAFLDDVMQLTQSSHGVIGEVLHAPDGVARFHASAVRSGPGDAQQPSRGVGAHEPQAFDFSRFDPLFDEVLREKAPAVSPMVSVDPASSHPPDGDPPPGGLLALPAERGGEVVAMVGLASHRTEYDASVARMLQPLLLTLAQLVDAARIRARSARDAAQLARLSQVASQTTNGVIITDRAGRVQWINEGFTRISGYRLEHLRGRRPGDVLQGPDSDPVTIAQMRAAIAAAEPFETDIVNYGRDGEPYWIRISCNPLHSANGSAEGFIAIETDITEKKHSELALQASEARFRGIFELSPVGMALNDYETGEFIDANGALLASTGYQREELFALSYWDLTPREYHQQEHNQLLQMERTGRYGPYEKEYFTRCGSRLPILLHGMVIREPGGRKLIWSMIEDISERKRLERIQNELVSTVSHELRTPLTSIVGALGLLRGPAFRHLPDQARALLEIAQNNGQRLSYLINDLLDIEKLSSGKMPLDLKAEDLLPIVERSVADNQSYARQFGVSLVMATRTWNVQAVVDSQRLLQVLANLISNAVKYSPGGAAVEISLRLAGGCAVLEVRDRGPGIPEEFRPMLFERFALADTSDSRNRGGTGLGLAITRELVDRMGGAIAYRPRTGGGSCFAIEFPTVGAAR